MLKKIFSLVLVVFLNLSFGHNEFYGVSSSSLVKVVYDGTNENLIVHWPSINHIPIYYGFFSTNIPDNMSFSTISEEFTNATNKWKGIANCLDFTSVNDAHVGVDLIFSTNPSIFAGGEGWNQAVTPLAVISSNNKYYFATDPENSLSQFPQTYILFNATSYPSERSFKWTEYFTLPNPTDYVNFQNVVLHELGHLIGCYHCDILGSYMVEHPFYVGTIYEFDLSSWESQSMNTMCLICDQDPASLDYFPSYRIPYNSLINQDEIIFDNSISHEKNNGDKNTDRMLFIYPEAYQRSLKDEK